MPKEEIIVLGAGASGMMAARTAAAYGAKVLLLEKMKAVGRKLLATGNGKCNFTNAYQTPECYRGEDAAFIQTALGEFTKEDVLRTFHEMGVLPKERKGYYYPASEQAASVVEAFRRSLNDERVCVCCGERVISLQRAGEKNGLTGIDASTEPVSPKKTGGFLVKTDKNSYYADKVILSMGGAAAPVHGTNGEGFALAEALGLRLVQPLPALTSCILKGDFMQEWSGVRVLGQISLYTKRGDCLAEESGELQMVSYGLSGIPVFQVSRYAARALEEGQKPYLVMDIMTEYSLQEVTEEIFRRQQSFPKWTGVDALDGMMHRKLAKVLLKSLGMDAGQGIGKWTTKQVEKVAERMKSWKLGIDAVSGFDKAQVTCGGVLTNQIDAHTMEVKTCPGLYITGELLDVDGICGGYNLQWAWTSGYLAGKSAASGSNS